MVQQDHSNKGCQGNHKMLQLIKRDFFLLSILVILISILVSSDYFDHYHDMLMKILHAAGILSALWLSRRLLAHTLWRLYKKIVGRPPPHLILTIQNVLLVTIGLFFVVGGVFHGSLLNVMAAGGLLTAGLAFALQGVIYDWFSGVVLDFDGPYQIGDWVRVRDVEGKVTSITWRHTTLVTTDNQVIHVPNSLFLVDAFKNLSRSEGYFYSTVVLSIDRREPIDRVRRILHAELSSLPCVYDGKGDVSARDITNDGVIYIIKYALTDYSANEHIRHQILDALTKALRRYDIKLSDGGIIAVVDNTPPSQTTDDQGDEQNKISVLSCLKKIDLFKPLAKKDIESLAKTVHQRTFSEGSDIVRQGEKGSSLYIVLEGLVDVLIKGPEDGEQHITFLRAGSFFGDRSLLMGEVRSATVRARTDVLLLEIDKETFEGYLKNNPKIVAEISRIMVERDHETAAFKKAQAKSKNKDTLESVIDRIEDFFGLIHSAP